MLGIIGYGMVGKAVKNGFPAVDFIISDPKYNSITVSDVCKANPEAIFVCIPTPTDDTNYSTLLGVLNQIALTNYKGIVVVKSTILPQYIQDYDVVFNPEFLSRATANDDFINPPMVILAGNRADELLEIYKKHSVVKLDNVFLTDIKTACLTKYVMNSFYATKITFMNAMYDIAQEVGANYDSMCFMLSKHPWMGEHHFQVPGPDGQRGFGGPCLPKDTEALTKEFEVPLLDSVLLLNKVYRQ